MRAEPVPCPHIPQDERAGDERQWCVVCLRNDIKRMKTSRKSGVKKAIKGMKFPPKVSAILFQIWSEVDGAYSDAFKRYRKLEKAAHEATGAHWRNCTCDLCEALKELT